MSEKDLIDMALSKVSFDLDPVSKTADGRTLTLWVRSDAKAKYEWLQNHSNKEFGKMAIEVLETMINRAYDAKNTASGF